MPIKISPSAVHDVTQNYLSDPVGIELFGKRLIACCLDMPEMFDLAHACVSYDCNTQGHTADDFLHPLDGLIFGSMQDYRQSKVEGTPWPKSRAEWAAAVSRHLNLFFDRHPEFPQAYRTEALRAIMTIPYALPGDYDLVADGLIDYVRGIRMEKAERRAHGLHPGAKHQAFEKVGTSIRIPGTLVEVTGLDSILESVFSVSQAVKPFATGITHFDRLYASRASGGDAWLVFGHPGSGKTNLACQTAGFTSALGKRVLYVTTEVPKTMILLRSCSAAAAIPYDTLKSMRGSAWNHPQTQRIADWVQIQKSNGLVIMDYREIQGENYKEKYQRMLDGYLREVGKPPELVVWDWIGSSLDSGFADPWQKREAYNGVAMMLVRSATELNCTTLTLAQASKETRNRATFSEQDTADSKSLCDGMTGVAGITSIQDNENRNTGEQDCYKDDQYLVVCKCRNELAKKLGVIRRFDMARFEAAAN